MIFCLQVSFCSSYFDDSEAAGPDSEVTAVGRPISESVTLHGGGGGGGGGHGCPGGGTGTGSDFKLNGLCSVTIY